MGEVIDLNALVPESRTIKFGDLEFELKAPKTEDVFKLGVLGEKLKDMSTLTFEEIEKLTLDLQEAIVRVIPELANQELNSSQLLALLGVIIEMAMPTENKELKDRGITVNEAKKTP